MKKLSVFSINLNNDRQVFYPGQQLSGYVIIELNKPMETRAVRIKFVGEGYCHWTEGSREDRTTYTGSEQLFRFVTLLLGSLSSSNESKVMLTQGQSTFPFVFTIPENMPSSFEKGCGHIRFELKGEIYTTEKFYEVKHPVILNEVIDPNNPEYLYASGRSEHKDVGCMCCAAGPLDITANVDRTCFCPGENILITAKVDNKTSRDMTAIKGKLVRVIAYHSSSKTIRRRKVMARIRGLKLLSGHIANWNQEPLPIPDVIPSIRNSKVITVSYHVKVEVEVPCASDAVVEIPVIIGTVLFHGQPVLKRFLPRRNSSEQPNNIAGTVDIYTQRNLQAFSQPQQGASGQAYTHRQLLTLSPSTNSQRNPQPQQSYRPVTVPSSRQSYPSPAGQPYLSPGHVITQQPGP